MKQILLLLIACLSLRGNAQTELAIRSTVFVVEKEKNIVWAQKIDGGTVFSFVVEMAALQKFKTGVIIGIQFNNKKAIMPDNERINVSNIDVPYIRAKYFAMHYAGIIFAMNPEKNSKIPEHSKMVEMKTIVLERSEPSNIVKACCEDRTSNGIQFILPSPMTELSLERDVFIFNNWVFVDKRNLPNPPLLIYPVSGRWIDTARILDSTHPTVSKGWDVKTNIKVRPNTSETDKWVITPVKDMKGVLGRLDINFPADAERSILIYQPTDNKFIASVSRNDKIYTIAPGQYRFTLTNVPVDNVPIEKGHETRLKAGILSVVSDGNWILYSDNKEKQYTSGNMPKKIPLPVGSYQLKLGTQFYPFVIKDRGTVEM